MEKIRTIKLFGNYYKEFYVAQTDEVRQKINQVLKIIETQRIVPTKFLKMKEEKKQAIMNCTTFEELLDEEYGPMGSPERMKFEADAEAFCLAETLKEQRRLAGLTQQELADKIGTKKSYISKLENGHADVQLSTLFRIFAGLGKRVSVAIL